jgi:hypothetical protein
MQGYQVLRIKARRVTHAPSLCILLEHFGGHLAGDHIQTTWFRMIDNSFVQMMLNPRQALAQSFLATFGSEAECSACVGPLENRQATTITLPECFI